MRRYLAVPLPLLAAGIAVPSAEAFRAPTKFERRTLAVYVENKPARCLNFRVSTVDSSYASITINRRHCRLKGYGGVTIVRRRGSVWRQRHASVACPPEAPTYIPRTVWRDLRGPFCPRRSL